MKVCLECSGTLAGQACPADGCPGIDDAAIDRSDPDVGRLVAGKYRVLECLGAGGMGAVYRTWQRDMHRLVALKVMKALANDEKGQKRFLREVRLVANLQHPNTVRVFDFGQMDDGRPFFTMELLDGEPLSKVVRRREPFDDRRMIRIVKQILKSLGEAHDAGVVHRDLSPENVFLVRVSREDDFVKVLDFGAATGAAPGMDDERLTAVGVFVGKPLYASPEQAEGVREIDGRSDLYALGVLMYQLIVGRVPFRATSPMKILMAHMQDAPQPISEVAPRPVHRDLAGLVMRLLAKRREDRPQSADEVLANLERIEHSLTTQESLPTIPIDMDAIDGGGPTLPLRTTGAHVLGRSRRRAAMWIGGAAVAAALAGGAWLAIGSGNRTEVPPEASPKVVAPAPASAPAPTPEPAPASVPTPAPAPAAAPAASPAARPVEWTRPATSGGAAKTAKPRPPPAAKGKSKAGSGEDGFDW